MPNTTVSDQLLDIEWLNQQFDNLDPDERDWLVNLIFMLRRKHLGIDEEPVPDGWIALSFDDVHSRVALLHPRLRDAVLHSGITRTMGQ